ncbi:carboxymuconolactone decarboxylase family protein [Natrarchaeobius chitinivorans]|uniref:Carboxymuconolactone decarboxylase family protein n=1 Tax=Natrarchaeobius chitinivorans TaxID=1679083 RepID=A0A3N6M0J8_NATCH|nr:carboxymuconolactone decarboxylase family protein [Natrarchaeobius chitinivorans]RQG95107.1 carboxymuconolactone decarboxylase family protein [Natrarchaeobius chitinivorans]
MASQQAHQEIEEYLGQVPSWMETIAEPASDHSWGLFRDLVLAETELSEREKGLVGLGVAAAIGCPYCTYFHKQEAQLADVSDAELEEAINVASNTRYFSTILHGNEIDHDEFVAETDEIVDYIQQQEAAPADD